MNSDRVPPIVRTAVYAALFVGAAVYLVWGIASGKIELEDVGFTEISLVDFILGGGAAVGGGVATLYRPTKSKKD